MPGTLIHARPDWLQRARPLVPWLIVASIALYAAFLWRIAIPPSQGQLIVSWDVAALEACLCVWLTLLCLLAGQRLLHRPNAVLRYLSQATYWTYLIYLPVLFVLQYQLMNLNWAWPIKLLLSIAGTFAVSVVSYGIVRHTALRRYVGEHLAACGYTAVHYTFYIRIVHTLKRTWAIRGA